MINEKPPKPNLDESLLPVPLYHGTSTLFLPGIAEAGLGGRNPIAEWRVLDFAREILPLVESHLASLADFMPQVGSFRRMAEQYSGPMNFQHGDTYLSPSKSTATRYALNKRYGSELLTYTLRFLQGLLDRNVPGVRDNLYRRYPQIFHKLDISVAPILIRIDGIPKSALSSEGGEDPSATIQIIMAALDDDPTEGAEMCQQENFRLRKPVAAANLQVWLIGVTKWDPLLPDHQLYPLTIPAN